ncbi:hypothetical protein GBAR_LOCUS14892 [Geodia barretti]|uniref:Uncharacterized protein n=1 Tax=Geodia barretti TaxID=519541 RepID=A0AA35WLG0_GEOBA|nr:hypothetical protein GBAR_LOCUS14892 [Geodia barretti]
MRSFGWNWRMDTLFWPIVRQDAKKLHSRVSWRQGESRYESL